MKDNKYYIPEIKEFHVGFKYQEYISGYWHEPSQKKLRGYWRDITVDNDPDLAYVSSLIESKDIRVKHLDKDDIEECGWFPLVKESRKLFLIDSDNERYFLHIAYLKGPLDVFLQISELQDKNMKHRTLIFSGTIKNISELKKLMKQLNIQNNG